MRAPSADRPRITGPGGPDQTADDRTWTSRVEMGALEGVVLGAAIGVAVGSAVGSVVARGVAATVRSTAVIASDDVPYGNVARRIPAASTRKTSAVCDIS